MRPLTSCWISLVVTVALAALPALSLGQDAQSDQAQALLKKGVAEFNALQYGDAKATLLQVDRTKLTAAEQKELDAHLSRVDGAIKQQAAAQEAYDQAVKALEANELDKAAKLFEEAQNSGHLPLPVRKNARAQAVLVAEKIKAAKAAQATQPAAPEPAKTTQPAKAVIAAKPEPSADKRLEELRKRFEAAKDFTAAGDKLLAEGKENEAIVEYHKAIDAFPEYEQARKQLTKAEGLLAEKASPGMKAITQLQRSIAVRRDELRVNYAQAMRRSQEAMQAGKGAQDFQQAADMVRHAQTLLVTSKSFLTDEEYRARKAETDQRLEHIAAEQRRWEEKKVQAQEAEIAREVLKREARMAREREEKITTLKRRARALRDEHKYAEAVDILDRVRELDPKDNWAGEQRRVLSQFVLVLQDKAAYRDALQEEERQMVGVREAAIPWYELLRYPRDWQEISLTRRPFGEGDSGESEANRAVHRALKQVLPKLNFSGIALGDVIQFVRDVSNISIHVKWEMLRQGSIDQKTPVNVELTQVTVEKALRTILDDVGAVTPLGFVVDEGVITISTRDDLATMTATRVYDIRDLIFQVPTFRGPRIDLANAGNNAGNNGSGSGSGGGLFGGGNNGGGNGAGDDDDTGTVSRQELVDSILDMIRTTIAPDTWQGGAAAGTTGSIRELNGQIIVTQTPENHRKVQDLLAQLREARAMLINVEARFITVNTGFLNRIGIDLDFYFNLGSRLQVDKTSLPTTSAIDPVTGAVVPNYANSTWTTTTGKKAMGTSYLTPMGLSQSSYQWVNAPMDSGLANSIGAVTNSAMSFAGTFLDDVQVDFLVSATQAHQATRTLTAPRVTIFNGQRAYVAIQEQQAYVAELEAVPGDNVVGYTPVIATVSTGSVLDVEGTISADRRYVNLTLQPQVSTIIGFIEYQGNPNIPGSGLIQLPNISLQEVRCTVSVPDGGTLLLGGQRLAGEREREMGVPILSRIPVLNRAFENRQIVRDQQTLLMLVKPKIIIQNEYEQKAFPTR